MNVFDLPPVPPCGIFDVRFESNRIAEQLNKDSKVISINGAEFPVTISVANENISLTDKATGGKLLSRTVKKGESIVIDNPAISAISVQSGEFPLSYCLDQNYPNPFNPSTIISFSLPEKARVSVIIYNQLGQQVIKIADGEKEAGNHRFEWNASGIASGIYFCKMNTEKFSSVKKLVFMK